MQQPLLVAAERPGQVEHDPPLHTRLLDLVHVDGAVPDDVLEAGLGAQALLIFSVLLE